MVIQSQSLAVALLVLISLAVISLAVAEGLEGPKIGGKHPIKNVKANNAVQSLGKYSVQQYLTGLKRGNGYLKFARVVEAKYQVTKGITYYLKVLASTADGVSKTFDAEVLVQDWLHNKQLLAFVPSTANIAPTPNK